MVVSDDEPAPPDSVVVTGTVSAVDSDVARDGGVTIHLLDQDENHVRLFVEPLHTRPRPTPERLELHRKVRELRAGDRVEVSGKTVDGGLWLMTLRILSTPSRNNE